MQHLQAALALRLYPSLHLTAWWGCVNLGCTNTAIYAIRLHKQPTARLSIALPLQSLCGPRSLPDRRDEPDGEVAFLLVMPQHFGAMT